MVNAVSSAISALQSIGKKIGVSANNIANSNTSGFKKSSASSTDVSGGGSILSEVSESFSQGAFVTTGSPTDLALSGDGYFILTENNGETYYTRDGEFDFDTEGNLADSSGNVVQGWAMDPGSGEISGSIGDINLDGLRTSPRATTTISTTVNLNAGSGNSSVGANALAAAWDGDSADGTYIDTEAYAYSTSTTVYDAQGGQHDITIYFDRSETTNEWEYIVTANPDEDSRMGASGDDLGLLGRGTLSFDTSGTLTDMTMAVNDGAGTWTQLDPNTNISSGNFAFQADFLGDASGSTVMNIGLDFGARYNGTQWVTGTDGSTQYASASVTVHSSSDGSAPGDLLSFSVGSDGVVTGSYSNGDTVDLFQIAVARFANTDGLDKVGQNLYTATSESGQAVTGIPGTNGLGSIVPNALEGSNVDLAEEFVNMTILQRSYEANLKVFQAEDEMKGAVLNIIS